MDVGGCRVWAGQVEVDATVGNRLAQVVVAVMGEERRRGSGDDSAEQ